MGFVSHIAGSESVYWGAHSAGPFPTCSISETTERISVKLFVCGRGERWGEGGICTKNCQVNLIFSPSCQMELAVDEIKMDF
jgi:hypothetical protein